MHRDPPGPTLQTVPPVERRRHYRRHDWRAGNTQLLEVLSYVASVFTLGALTLSAQLAAFGTNNLPGVPFPLIVPFLAAGPRLAVCRSRGRRVHSEAFPIEDVAGITLTVGQYDVQINAVRSIRASHPQLRRHVPPSYPKVTLLVYFHASLAITCLFCESIEVPFDNVAVRVGVETPLHFPWGRITTNGPQKTLCYDIVAAEYSTSKWLLGWDWGVSTVLISVVKYGLALSLDLGTKIGQHASTVEIRKRLAEFVPARSVKPKRGDRGWRNICHNVDPSLRDVWSRFKA